MSRSRTTARERRPDGPLGTRVVPILLCGLGMWLVVGMGLAAGSAREVEDWAEGPVRWLLLPGELKELRNIYTEGGSPSSYIEIFWERRDPDRQSSDNNFREVFLERVEAADQLYSDEGIRGSLTDRGRALILMGSPSHLTVSTEPVMAFDAAKEIEDRVSMRSVDVEIWGYRMEDLPPGTLDIWLAKKKKAAEDTLTLTLRFRTVGRRTSLVDGEALLDAAARAAALQTADD